MYLVSAYAFLMTQAGPVAVTTPHLSGPFSERSLADRAAVALLETKLFVRVSVSEMPEAA